MSVSFPDEVGQLTYSDPSTSTPRTIALTPGQRIELQSVVANFDGTGAGATFNPTLTIYSQDGKILARTSPRSFEVGDTGVVSYNTFLSDGDDDGIHYGRNFGDFLFVEADGALGIRFVATNGDLSLQASNVVLVQGDFESEPIGVNDQANFSVVLGKPTTDSHFIVTDIGVGNDILDIDSDTESVTIFLNGGSSRFEVKNGTGFVTDIASDSTFVHSLQNNTAQFVIQDDTARQLVALNGDGTVFLKGEFLDIQILGVGQDLTVRNSSGNPVFRIDDNGALHGKTGQALTFDL